MTPNQTAPFAVLGADLDGAPHDVLVADGRIAGLRPSGSLDLPADAERIDATGLHIFPSFIDAHVHLREPGFEYKEDISSGLSAAAFGGFGAVLCMANTDPVNDSAAITRYMLERARAAHPHGPRLHPVGALTLGLEGKALAPMGELVEAGCAAFSNDGKPVMNSEIFRRAVEYAAQWGKLVIDHCEDAHLAAGTHMNEGMVSGRIGVAGQSTVAEAMQVARDILLAEYLNLPIHLAHISCRQSVDLIRFAKAKGVPITAETCPHYLHLDDSALEAYDTAAKVCPPLRAPEDVIALRRAVGEGVFDIFVTDHAPHAAHEKEEPLDEAPNGMIGLETAVPLTWELVRSGELSASAFTAMWSSAPARIFNLPEFTLRTGASADFFLFDPRIEWTPSRQTLHSKSLNTPFLGKKLRGKVTRHWMGGTAVI
jgi:dihydroorotase